MSTPHSCDQLGVCHGRPSASCTCRPDEHFFAPGVIEAHANRRRLVWSVAKEVAAALALCGLAVGAALLITRLVGNAL